MGLQLIRRNIEEAKHSKLPLKGQPAVHCAYDKLVPVEELKPHPRNPNKHPKEQIELLAHIMMAQGIRRPIVVSRRSGLITIGHGRLEAAKLNGWKGYPVDFQEYESEAMEYADMVADNKIAELSEVDMAMVNEDFVQFGPDFDVDLLGIPGFEIEPFDALVNEDEEDKAPSPPKVAKTRLGDLYILGNHRLLCGDSTNLDHLKRLVGNEKVDFIFTDPPYGMSYGGGRAEGDHILNKKGGVKIKAHGMIKGDDLRGEDLCQLLTDSLSGVVAVKKPNAAVYVCLTWRTYGEFTTALEKVGLKLQNCIVWNKRSIGLGYSHYRPQHEFIFYCGGDWNGRKDESDVWEMTRGNTGEYVHPTQKPVELVERAIRNSSKKLGIVLDLFGGSGSTLIAAEKTKRQCRIMELDPKYCDVIVERWEICTGKKAKLHRKEN